MVYVYMTFFDPIKCLFSLTGSPKKEVVRKWPQNIIPDPSQFAELEEQGLAQFPPANDENQKP